MQLHLLMQKYVYGLLLLSHRLSTIVVSWGVCVYCRVCSHELKKQKSQGVFVEMDNWLFTWGSEMKCVETLGLL